MQSKITIHLFQFLIVVAIGSQSIDPVGAIVSPDADIPEEILRAEIITEARSPIDGRALSATEFAELVVTTKQRMDLDDADVAIANPRFKETIFLLRLRGFLKSVGIPIK
jgi:hypothetical protein